jgi:hypothetical protein
MFSRLAINIVSISLLWGTAALAQGVPQTKVSAGVSESGSAQISIPIQVAPGISGMEPKLSLSYDSASRSGVVGAGISISGLSSITRCAQTPIHDKPATDPDANKYRGKVRYDANDRFCYDGQRLILTDANGNYITSQATYGAAGSEYRTASDSITRIRAFGARDPANPAAGPDYFIAWTKAGLKIFFGESPNTKINAQGKTAAVAWPVNRILDVNGNKIGFVYSVTTPSVTVAPAINAGTSPPIAQSPVNLTAQEWVIDKVVYAFDNAGTPTRSVQFTYETRPDIAYSFYEGSMTASTLRLTRVQSDARRYSISYQPVSGINNQSMAERVQECDATGTTCLPAVKLVRPTAAGTSQFVPKVWPYPGNWFGANNGWTDDAKSPRMFGDIDGDGRFDIIGLGSDGVNWWRNTGAGFVWGTAYASNDAPVCNYGWCDESFRTAVDINGDGRTDIVGFTKNQVRTLLARADGQGFEYSSTYSSAPNALFALEDVKYGTGTRAAFAKINKGSRSIRLDYADVNGDGLPDMVLFSLSATRGIRVALNTGSGFAPSTQWAAWFTGNGWDDEEVVPRFVTDINGDGKADVLGFSARDGVFVALSTGSTFAAPVKWADGFGDSYKQSQRPRKLADVNGDGLLDLVVFDSRGVLVGLNNGKSFAPITWWTTEFICNQAGNGWCDENLAPKYLVDLNNDGKADLVGFSGFNGVNVAYSSGSGFAPSSIWIDQYRSENGWRQELSPRYMGDFDGDGLPDIIGFGGDYPIVTFNNTKTEKQTLVTAVTAGLTGSVGFSYRSMLDASVYTKGSGSSLATDGRIDVIGAGWLVKEISTPTGTTSGNNIQQHSYGAMKSANNGIGSLGFAWTKRDDTASQTVHLNEYRQDYPYIGLPSASYKSLRAPAALNGVTAGNTAGLSGVLNKITNTYVDKQTDANSKVRRVITSQSVEQSWGLAGESLPTVTTTTDTNTDLCPTTVTVTTAGSTPATGSETFTKTTTNTYNTPHISGEYLIVCRLNTATVRSQQSTSVPASSAGSSPYATATQGSLEPLVVSLTKNGLTTTQVSDVQQTAGLRSASVDVNVNSGVAPFTYSWERWNGSAWTAMAGSRINVNNGTPATFSANLNLGELVVEKLRLTVFDQTGRNGSQQIDVSLGAVAPVAVTVTPSVISKYSSYAGQTTASAQVTVSGGVGALTWSVAQSSGTPINYSLDTVNSSAAFGLNLGFGQEARGIFRFTAVDSRGVSGYADAEVILNVAENFTPLTQGVVMNGSTSGLLSGTISASASGGRPPYSCSWGAGVNVSVLPSGCSATVSRNAVWNDHGQEGIAVTVCDANGRCDNTRAAIVEWHTPAPNVTISPASYHFGSVADLASATTLLTVTNSAAVPVAISSSLITSESFSIIPGGSCPPNGSALAPGASCTVQLRYIGNAQCGGTVIYRNASFVVSGASWSTSAALTAANRVYKWTDLPCR